MIPKHAEWLPCLPAGSLPCLPAGSQRSPTPARGGGPAILVMPGWLPGVLCPPYSENDGMPWNNPEVQIETDVEYAKKLLADAGWADTDKSPFSISFSQHTSLR